MIFDGVSGGKYHDYTLVWAPGLITFKVDGVTKGTSTATCRPISTMAG